MYPLDAKLAVQVGLLLLRNNKELEAVLEVTEKQYEEEKSRADVSVEAFFSYKILKLSMRCFVLKSCYRFSQKKQLYLEYSKV